MFIISLADTLYILVVGTNISQLAITSFKQLSSAGTPYVLIREGNINVI